MSGEPASVRDMKWAASQMAGSSVIIEHHYDGNRPSEGALSHTEVGVRASVSEDMVEVRRSTYRYKEPLGMGWSLEGEHETLARLTFDEFRASEWWEPYLAKTRRLSFDSSWMDSFEVETDEGYVEVTFGLPERERVWWCSGDVPNGRVQRCRACVGSDGVLYLEVGKEGEEAGISEFVEAVRRLRALEEAGVSLDDEGNVVIRRTAEGKQ